MRRQMRSDLISELVACLDHLAEHPEWSRNLVPPGQELTYISGVSLGVRFALDIAKDPERERELRHKAAMTRGWAIDRHPYEQMRERRCSADEILSELARL